MKKGLTLTLLTVAVAMWGMQAMAEAPTISDLPTVVVGGTFSTTEANRFVYPDAFNLDAYVSDDTTADADLKWSYEVDGTAKYKINNADPIDSSSEDPITPDDGKQINLTDTDPAKGDTNPRTITIRNVNLSPIGATPASQTDPGANDEADYVSGENQAITLHASDGTTYSSATMFVYTDNGGNDRLNSLTRTAVPTQVISWDFEGNTDSWTYAGGYTGVSSATSSTSSNTAICLTTAPDVVNNYVDYYGLWSSPISDIPIVANQVYRIRATVTSSNASPGATPLWDMYLNNYDGTNGLNLYGNDLMFYDVEGGANAAITAEKTYEMWWTPPPADISNTAWNDETTGGFGTDNGSNTSVGLVFRTLDFAAGRTDLACGLQSGTICMTEATVERYALDAMQVGATLYSPTALTRTTASVTGTVLVDEASYASTGSTITDTAGVLTITPSTTGSAPATSAALFTIDPGTDTAYDLGQADTIDDNYPIAWESNKLLRISAEFKALDATAATNPPDVIMFLSDSPGNEIISQSFITRTGAGACATAGMPKTDWGLYQAFVWTHTESVSESAHYHFMRPRIFVMNNLGVTGTGVNNSGAIQIRNYKVEEVQF